MSAKEEICAVCGGGTARERCQSLRKVLLGHSVTYARREYLCATCDETYTDDEQGAANEAAERRAIRKALAVIGPKEIRLARKYAHATQRQMEEILGLGRNTLARWETAQRPVPNYIKAAVRLIALNPLAANLLREVGSVSGRDVVAVAEVIDLSLYLKGKPTASPYHGSPIESADAGECLGPFVSEAIGS